MTNFIMNKIEETIGFDLDGNGQIGGPGITSHIEKATHVDFNRDGVIGHRAQPGGGLVGKIEQITHIDINKNGRIDGRPGQSRPH